MTWSASQYSRFEAERTRPVRDLVAAIPLADTEVRNSIDLGCGPGNSTEVLQERYSSAHIEGLDNDHSMIEAARKRLPGIGFALADIGQWKAEQAVDVILANASLQWLPEHQRLYPHLVQQLRDGGCLAVQTPDNLQEPAHLLAREVAASGPWAHRIGDVRHPERHDAAWYYALVRPVSRHVDVWRTTYMHPLQDHQAVVEWFKGSALRPFLAQLDEAEQAQYLQRYLEGVRKAYPALDDGTVLLPFPRLFLVAVR